MYLPMASDAVAAGTLHMNHTVHINEMEVVDQFASDVQRLCSPEPPRHLPMLCRYDPKARKFGELQYIPDAKRIFE
jgi:hypothetical protein